MNASRGTLAKIADASTPGYAASAPWLVISILGTMLNLLAYQSWQPLFVATSLYGTGYLVLLFTPLGGHFERSAFRASFATAWCAAGVAALFLQIGHDPVQMDDAEDFFVLASDPYASSLGAFGLSALTSGSGAIILWRKFYELFSVIGIERHHYIGISVNSLAVAINAVLAIKIVRKVYGDNVPSLRRAIIAVALCGTYALFASIHLRDALVLVCVTALTYSWVCYLHSGGLIAFLLLGVITAFAAIVMPLLRVEFFFVPIAMAAAGIASILLFDPTSSGRRGVILMIGAIGVVTMSGLLVKYQEEILFILRNGSQNYANTSALERDAGSLGSTIIISAPFPARAILGSIYLFAFPIPVWSGFQLRSAYHLFTSLNAIYFYITVPLFIVALTNLLKSRSMRTPAPMFLLFLVLGFTATIASSSLETRHLGAFLVAFQTLVVLPDLRNPSHLKLTLWLWRLMLLCVIGVHLAWAILKYARG